MHLPILRSGLVTATLLTAIAAAACGRSTESAKGPAAEAPRAPVDVAVGRVESGSLPRIVRATGTLAPEDVVTVAAEVSGKIVELYCDVGDRVATGDKLARVDDADYVLERDQRRRAVDEALARLGLESLPDGDVDFERLPSIERARLEAANAKAKLDRLQKLHDRTPPLISDQDYADARTAWDVAESGRRLALLTAQAELATARTRRAELDVAEKRLRDVLHVVPGTARAGDGSPAGARNVYLVAARLAAAGDRVSVGMPLVRLVDADPLRLRVEVPERRMEGVAVGRPAKLSTAAAGPAFTGSVARIRPDVDPRTRTVDVEIAVANPDFRLSPGAFAAAEIDVGTDDAVALVPESAVRSFAGVQKVFTVADGKTAEKVVVVGRRTGGKLEITSGLKPGDEIVLEPPSELVAGVPARAVPAPAAGEKK